MVSGFQNFRQIPRLGFSFFWILPLNISLEKWGAPQSCNFSLKPTQWFENVWSNGGLNYPCQLINLIHISTVLAGHTEPYHVHMSIKQKLHHTAMWVWYDARSQAQLCPKTIEPALKKSVPISWIIIDLPHDNCHTFFLINQPFLDKPS
jgi:hypothetical protein